MIDYKKTRKIISIMIIVAFVCHFHSDIFLHAQEIDETLKLFNMAKKAYIIGNYVDSKNKLELVTGIIDEENLEIEKKDILGGCILLKGAIYEKEENISLAEKNYRTAKEKYGIVSIEGVDLDDLPIYKKVVKVEIYIETQFQKAVGEYNNGQYDSSKSTLEGIIGIIKKEGLEVKRKDILGKCYLMLGAIYEKKGETILAEEYYGRAKNEYGTESVEGVELKNLKIFKRVIKGIIEIEKEGVKRIKKKKFPVLLVIGGVAVVAAAVFLLTKKKEEPTPSPNPWFITSTDNYKYNMDVPEGGTATFDVRLSEMPSSEVSASVARIGGDTDISVQSGSSLTFTTANWNQNQTVTLAAKEDSDVSSDIAIIRIYAPGFADKDITVDEQDNDRLSIETNTDIVTVKEGQTATFQVRLSHQLHSTQGQILVSVSRVSGDTDINVQSGENLTFTRADWNIYRTVTLSAEEDPDTTNGIATVRIIGQHMYPRKDITAIEDDNDGNPTSILNTYPPNEATVSCTESIHTNVSAHNGVNRTELYIKENDN